MDFSVGNGKRVIFWRDRWYEMNYLTPLFPPYLLYYSL